MVKKIGMVKDIKAFKVAIAQEESRKAAKIMRKKLRSSSLVGYRPFEAALKDYLIRI